MFEALADPVLPVFAVMALGLVAGKVGLFSAEMARNLNAFVFFVGQPALIFLLAANASLGEYNLPALGSYLASEILIYAGVALVAWKVFRRDPREAILLGMTAVFVNHLFYVLPIVQSLRGGDVTAPIEGVIFVDVAILFCGTIFVMELASRSQVSLKEYPAILARNPALLALLAGIAASFAGPAIPSGVETFARFTGNSAPPISLFALGVILAGVKFGRPDGLLTTIVLSKILLHPAVAFGLFFVAGAPAGWSTPLLVVAAGPCGAMPFVIALQYNVETGTMAKAILASTVLTLVSLAALTGLLPE